MKLIGIIILALGLLLGGRALTMDVGVDVPAGDFGYGVTTPAMRVANVDLMTQRQNYLIFSGILAVVGAILTGFASMQPTPQRRVTQQPREQPLSQVNTNPPKTPSSPNTVSICSKCRSMGPGDLTSCPKCGTAISSTV